MTLVQSHSKMLYWFPHFSSMIAPRRAKLMMRRGGRRGWRARVQAVRHWRWRTRVAIASQLLPCRDHRRLATALQPVISTRRLRAAKGCKRSIFISCAAQQAVRISCQEGAQMSGINGYHHLTLSTDGAQEDFDFY